MTMSTTLERQLKAQDGCVELTDRGAMHAFVNYLKELEAGTGLAAGFLSADAWGRSLMAADYFGASVAASQAHFQNGFFSADDTMRAKFAASFLGNSAIGRALMQDGFFSADATGRGKFGAGFFGAGDATSYALFDAAFWTNAQVAKFADDLFAANAASRAKFTDGIWTPAKLSFEPAMDGGELSSFSAHFVIGAFPVGQTIQVSATETWTGRAAPAAPFEFLSGVGAAADMAAFVAAVNAEATSVARAVAAGGLDSAKLVAKLPTTALAGVSSHANCVISQTNAPVPAADATICRGQYTVDAGGVDLGRLAAGDEIVIGAFQGAAGLTPDLFSLRCTTAAGADKPINTTVPALRATAAGNCYLVCLADAGAVLNNSDVLRWTAIY